MILSNISKGKLFEFNYHNKKRNVLISNYSDDSFEGFEIPERTFFASNVRSYFIFINKLIAFILNDDSDKEKIIKKIFELNKELNTNFVFKKFKMEKVEQWRLLSL